MSLNINRSARRRAISATTVLDIWGSALNLGEEVICQKCEKFVSQHVAKILEEPEAEKIPKDLLTCILSLDKLSISEVGLFKFVVSWITRTHPAPDTISELISLIRFPQMKPDEIMKFVRSVPYVPSEARLEALEYFHDPSLFKDSAEKKYQPRNFFKFLLCWSKEASNSTCKINDNEVTWSDGGTALALLELRDGLAWTWEIQIITMARFFCFGVAQRTTDISRWYSFGFDATGWGWGYEGSHFSHNNASRGNTYRVPLSNGDIVRLTLTADRTLSFHHNGLAVGQHPLKPTGQLYPAIVSGGVGCCKLFSFNNM